MRFDTNHGRARWAIEVAIVAAAYYAAARLGLLLQLPGTNASPVWPPSGIGFAAVLLRGLHVWPGILLGAFFANLLTLPVSGAGWVASAGICIGNTAEHVVALLLLRWQVAAANPFNRARDVFRFVLVAPASCALASTTGAVFLTLTGIIPAAVFGSVWFTWWLGDTAGMLVLSPAIYGWGRQGRLGLPLARAMELAAVTAASLAAVELLFGGWFDNPVIGSLPYLVVPGLLWAAVRFGPRETATLATLVSAVAIAHTWRSMRPAAIELGLRAAPFVSPAISPNDSLLMLQIFVVGVSVTAAILAAAVEERRAVEQNLVEDITERQRAEDRSKLLAEATPNALVMVGRDGRIHLANAQAEQLFGYRPKELLGQSVEILVPERFRARHPELRRGFFADPTVRLMGAGRDLFGVKKDGSEVPVEIGLNPIRTGEGDFVLAAIIDITDRRRAQEWQANLVAELASVNRELNDFAYVVSHDLKAPLRGIGQLAEWLAEENASLLDETGKGYLAMMARRVRRMNDLIDGILHYSRLGWIREEQESVDLNLVLRDVLDLLAPPEHIQVVVQPGLPTVRCHKMWMHQVFQNLLNNAIRFLDKPQGQITVSCEDRGEFWEFRVRDNGPGIDPKHHGRIFQMFQTLSPRDEVESTGIGLALVKKIVDRSGGRIWVESRLGAGSTFVFTLPKFAVAVPSGLEGRRR